MKKEKSTKEHPDPSKPIPVDPGDLYNQKKRSSSQPGASPPPSHRTRILTGEEYGIGIDCHSKFIQVAVIIYDKTDYFEYQHEFTNDWNSLVKAREWVVQVLNSCADPPIKKIEPLKYVLESSAVYHCPVVLCWKGTPAIINPVLAGAQVRKTDCIDASRLARQSLAGLWRSSYIPSTDVTELRVLIDEREYYQKIAKQASQRINSTLVRFGVTVSRDGSVTEKEPIRSIVENLLSDNPEPIDNICPEELPPAVKKVLKKAYERYDNARKDQNSYEQQILEKVKSMEWEMAEGKLPGDKMLALLCTCPGVGERTASVWLANIITPVRFPNSRACSAYCGLDPSVQVSAKHVTSRFVRKGNDHLHSALTQAASILIKNHNELFGRWGYQMYLQNRKWKTATNAVARKIAVALYHMQSAGLPFSYERYNILKEVVILEIPIEDLPLLNRDFKRYIRLLKENGIDNTTQMIAAYNTCQLVKIKGVGQKFFGLLKDFVQNQNRYKKTYEHLKEDMHAD